MVVERSEKEKNVQKYIYVYFGVRGFVEKLLLVGHLRCYRRSPANRLPLGWLLVDYLRTVTSFFYP